MKKNMFNDNLLLKFQVRNTDFYISFIDELTCRNWGKYWGYVNANFNNEKIMQRIKNIVINFEDCLYADPIALMSILLDLLKVKEEYKITIKIILPRIMSNDIGKKNYKKGAFLKFLAVNGFLEIMSSHFIVKDSKRNISKNIINHYMKYNYSAPFSGDVIVPFKIYECDNETSKKAIIEETINLLLFNFKSRVSTHNYNVIEGYVYNIINELVENSIRHAYKSGEKKRFALYIRNRKGSDAQGINGFLQREISREKDGCPALDSQIYMENSAFLEIFFSDIGMGLTESLKDYYESQGKDYTYPVRELFCKVLKDGIRKNNKSAITPFGGLHFICRIIRETNGYIWCNEGKEWIGASSVRLLSNGVKEPQVALTTNEDNNQNRGLNWCFRIPYNDFSKSAKNTFASVWNGDTQSHPVFTAYKLREKDIELNNLVCIDEINKNTILMNGNCKKWNYLNIDSSVHNNFKIESLIWKPKQGYTKNQISTQLKQHLNNLTVFKFDNLIISDINSTELLSYFYAFNKNTTRALNAENIKTITIITNRWEVICFKNATDTFIREQNLEFKYFTNNKGHGLSENIQNYASFIRKYDSYCFWELVKKYKEEKIYINANVKWGNQDIHGYLDLERTYLYSEFYDIITTSLLRMSGLISDENVEYKNIDQTVERVCQDINNSISLRDGNITYINVCGACATGYTRESYYYENGSALDVILFVHPLFKKSLDNVAILFIWPGTSFFDEFPIENDLYYRLGKTSSITIDPKEKLINIPAVYNNVTRNKYQMYEDFQMKTPKFIKYGHYKTDNHHYLIGFDFISYLKYSYLKKEGVVAYFLWKIIYYLVGEDISTIYNSLKDKQWIKPLMENKYTKDSNHGELVVYHSNTFTEYIMKLIKSILPNELTNRIIPVSILSLQDKGNPLVFSPFVTRKIQSVFEEKNNKGILYIDSSFSTGRRMIEIENVFLSLGCKKVSFLTILDMRRLRNVDFKNNSFWKINLPRLDDNSHCVLCDTLKKVEDYKKKTDSVICERLLLWERNWKCLNINNSIGEHGIESVENLNCTFEDAVIHDSTTLNVYIAERICESYSNDFVYNYVTDQKTDLDKFLRIQLICTQIVLFGNQHSRKLQLSMLSELLGIMAKTTEVNAYTSLAGLVIISQKSEVMYELLNEILYLNQLKKIQQIKISLLSSKNIDLVISIGYFLKNNYLIEQLINGFPDKTTSPFINMINEHILPDKNLKLLFKEFEGLYINEMGRRHNTNCQKLLTEHSTEYNDFEKRCSQVINDVNRLCELIKHFPIALKNSCSVELSSRQQLNDYIAKLILEMKKRQQEYQCKLHENKTIHQFNAGEDIQLAVKDCEKIFNEIINSYYICYDEETCKYFSHMISIYEKKHSKKIELNIESEGIVPGVNKYYYWNSSIEKEFMYMLENLEHCNLPLDPNDPEIMMKVDILFQFNKILIKFFSWSEKMAAQVKDVFLSKNRLSKEQAIAFDVIFDFVDKEKNNEDGYFLLESKISIPACYPQLKGD